MIFLTSNEDIVLSSVQFRSHLMFHYTKSMYPPLNIFYPEGN